MNDILVLDTETTGLPKVRSWNSYYDPKDFEKYDSSRIVSIAFVNGEYQKYHIIKPSNFKVDAVEIHGITQEIAEKEGITLYDFFTDDNFMRKLIQCDNIVGHNINFDIYVLCSELYRHSLDDIANIIFAKNRVCSKQMGKEYLKMMRYPSLVELYYTLFQKEFEAHNALEDALACLNCFEYMSK